jgi:tetratricopeptide (TPR) repeat protein
VRKQLAEIYEDLTDAPVPQPAEETELSAGEWMNKGLSLNNLGRFEEALDCLNHALTLNPLEALPWYNKGMALKNLGRFEEALACLEEAQKLGFSQAAQAIARIQQYLDS